MTAYRGLLWEVFTPPQLLLRTLVSGKPAILTICILPVAVTSGYKRFVFSPDLILPVFSAVIQRLCRQFYHREAIYQTIHSVGYNSLTVTSLGKRNTLWLIRLLVENASLSI